MEEKQEPNLLNLDFNNPEVVERIRKGLEEIARREQYRERQERERSMEESRRRQEIMDMTF